MTALGAQQHESRWLLRLLAWACASFGVVLVVLGFALDVPRDATGDGLQFLGLLVAALGVPVVEPWLAGVEDDAAGAARRVVAAAKGIPETVRRGLARFRGRIELEAHVGAGAKMTASGSVVVTAGRTVDRTGVSDREWLGFLNDELDLLRETVRQLQVKGAAERGRVDALLIEQRQELQAHTLAITRGGWKFILAGALCTALGILLGLTA